MIFIGKILPSECTKRWPIAKKELSSPGPWYKKCTGFAPFVTNIMGKDATRSELPFCNGPI